MYLFLDKAQILDLIFWHLDVTSWARGSARVVLVPISERFTRTKSTLVQALCAVYTGVQRHTRVRCRASVRPATTTSEKIAAGVAREQRGAAPAACD